MQLDQMLTRGYIIKILSQNSGAIAEVGDFRDQRSKNWHQLEPTEEINIGK